MLLSFDLPLSTPSGLSPSSFVTYFLILLCIRQGSATFLLPRAALAIRIFVEGLRKKKLCRNIPEDNHPYYLDSFNIGFVDSAEVTGKLPSHWMRTKTGNIKLN
jgi:hypothetical protein